MPRYIDAEKLSKDVISSWDKDKHYTIEASRVHRQEHHHLMRIIEKQPTVDVVSKSEIEKIFAEIEKEIDLGISVIQKILNAKGGRANGKTVLISKYDVYIEAKKHLAELKKRYTEQVIDNAERCIVCGEVIPEGRQVCPMCEKQSTEQNYFSPDDVRGITAKEAIDNFDSIMRSMKYWNMGETI